MVANDRTNRARMLQRYKSAKERQLQRSIGGEDTAIVRGDESVRGDDENAIGRRRVGGETSSIHDDRDDNDGQNYENNNDVENDTNLTPNNHQLTFASNTLQTKAATPTSKMPTSTMTVTTTSLAQSSPPPQVLSPRSAALALRTKTSTASSGVKDRAATIATAKRRLAASRLAAATAAAASSSSSSPRVSPQKVVDILDATTKRQQQHELEQKKLEQQFLEQQFLEQQQQRQQQQQQQQQEQKAMGKVSQRERFQRLRQKQQQNLSAVENTVKTMTKVSPTPTKLEGFLMHTAPPTRMASTFSLGSLATTNLAGSSMSPRPPKSPMERMRLLSYSSPQHSTTSSHHIGELFSDDIQTTPTSCSTSNSAAFVDHFVTTNVDCRDDECVADNRTEEVCLSSRQQEIDQVPTQQQLEQKQISDDLLHDDNIEYDDEEEVNDDEGITHLGAMNCNVDSNIDEYIADQSSPIHAGEGGEYEYTTSISEDASVHVEPMEEYVDAEDLTQPQEILTPNEDGENATSVGVVDNANVIPTCNASHVVDGQTEENNSGWPANLDSFSPTSWGTPTLLQSKSESDWYRGSWENDNTVTAGSVHSGGDEKVMQSTTTVSKAISEEENLVWSASGVDQEENNEMNVPNVEMVEALHVMDVKSDCSSAYEGFGSMLDSGIKNSKEDSRYESFVHHDDDDDDDDDEENNNSVGAASEGTEGTTTAFDPLSMFGEEEIIEDCEIDGTANADTAFSSSPGSAAFEPSLTSGINSEIGNTNNSKAQALYQQGNFNGRVIPSPAGSESLESWWQNRYASTQSNDVNLAVLEALTKSVVIEKEELPQLEKIKPSSEISTLPNQAMVLPTMTSASCNGPNGVESKSQYHQLNLKNQSSLLSMSDEEDSVFGSLIDDEMPMPSSRPSVDKSIRASSPALIVNTTTDEDIFSGVSVSSQQQLSTQLSSLFPRLKESNAMKSILDDGTQFSSQFPRLNKSHAMKSLLDDGTVESPSNQQPPKYDGNDYSKAVPNPQADSSASVENHRLFISPVEGYGVINLQKIEQSPTNESITSDITSSVVFGYSSDFARRKTSLGRQDILETHNEIVCDANEDHEDDDEDEEQILPHSAVGDGKINFFKDANRVISLISPSTDDITSHLSAKAGDGSNKLPEAEANSTNATGNRGVMIQSKKSQDSALLAPTSVKPSFLSQLSSCRIFASSSFVYCAGATEEQVKESRSGNGQEDVFIKKSSDDERSGHGSAARKSLDSTLSVVSKVSNYLQANLQRSESASTNRTGSHSDSDSDNESNNKEDNRSCYSDDDASAATTNDDDNDSQVTDNESPSCTDETSLRLQKSIDSTQAACTIEATLSGVVQSQSSQKIERQSETAIKAKLVESEYRILEAQAERTRQIFDRLKYSGIEVLKLNREKNWQLRFLTVTDEVLAFEKSAVAGVDSCPVGLLWVKKFDHGKQHTLASLGKNGKGGMLFNWIEHMSVTKDNNPLNRKQQKGKFKNSITLALYLNADGYKREVLFRCANKEDAFALSSGFQLMLDCMKKDGLTEQQRTQSSVTNTGVDSNGLDRWEL